MVPLFPVYFYSYWGEASFQKQGFQEALLLTAAAIWVLWGIA
jgi:hypothetical protein